MRDMPKIIARKLIIRIYHIATHIHVRILRAKRLGGEGNNGNIILKFHVLY